MKIWLLSEDWLPAVGGVTNYLSHLSTALAKEHELTVFVPGKKNKNDPNYVERTRFSGFLIKPKWLPLLRYLHRQADQSRPDVFLCGKALFEGRLALRLKQKLGLPYFIFTYGKEIETWASHPKHSRQLAGVLAEADGIIYINEKTKRTLLSLGAKSEQLLKLTPGVNERFLNQVSPALAESTARHYGIKPPYILSVGRLVERKGFDLLLQAFAGLDQTKFSDLDLVIVGAGPWREHLETIIEREFLSTSVKILTDVPDKHLPPLYAGAELFALTPRELPDDYEGFGIVYLEAAAVGIPSVGTKTGGVSEAIEDQVTGILVEADNQLALTESLTELLENEDRRQQLGSSAQKKAQQLTWPARSRVLIELISDNLTK